MFEGRTIQKRLPKVSFRPKKDDHIANNFAKLVFQGKIKAAIDLLSNKVRGRVLHLDDIISSDEQKGVRDILRDKHPPSQSVHPESIVPGDPQTIQPVVFDSIDASVVRSAALKTNGAAGPSGIDAHGWRQLCTSLKSASSDLCQSLALTAKRLCTSLVDPKSVAPLMACRLLALDKNPGVHPIGVGETARRIIAKAVLSVIRGDVQNAAGVCNYALARYLVSRLQCML